MVDDLMDHEPTEEPQETVSSAVKPASALSRIRRELSEDDLASPGVQRLLLDRLDKLEDEVVRLEGFAEKYYQADKEVAVLSERSKRTTAFEVLYSAALAFGAICIGLAPGIGKKAIVHATFIVGAGIVLMGGAVLAKVLSIGKGRDR